MQVGMHRGYVGELGAKTEGKQNSQGNTLAMHRREKKKGEPNVCFVKTNEPTGLHVLGPDCGLKFGP